MAPTMKLSLLALVGAAAAVPHYAQHSKFHHKPSSGYAGPTGGWGLNSTALPTGTGVVPGDESTTETTTTSTIKSTLTQTLYVTPVPASEVSSVQAAEKPTGLAGSGAGSVCGPATVTVTATNKVTVTVPAGGASSPPSQPPSHAPEAPKPSPYVPEAPKPSVPAPSAPSKEEEKPTAYPTQAPSTKEPVPSSKETPVYEPSKPAPSAPAAPSSSTAPSSSSAAPKPSNPPSTGGKRGLLYRWDGAAAAKGFAQAGHFGWASNWEADSKGDIGGIEFVPTLRSSDRADGWAAAIDTAAASGTKVVFTFNEPDMPGQANMSPDVACNAWKDHVAPLVAKHSGISFVGPSVSSSASPGQGLSWLEDFHSKCPEAQYGAANFHWYGTPADGVEAFKAHIEDAHKRIGKDFYVTEFAVNHASGEESAEFLKGAQAYLDSNPNCLGYSYFAVGDFNPDYGMTAANLLGTAENPTPAGKVYIA